MSLAFSVLFWFVMVGYALATALTFFGHSLNRTWSIRAGQRLTPAVLMVHTVIIGWRWVLTGHIPTIGLFENALVGSWFIVLMAWWFHWKGRFPLILAGTLPLALLILAAAAFADTSVRPMVAALVSVWLYIHIFFAWLAYGSYSVACGAAVVYLYKSRSSMQPDREKLGRLDELMFRSTVFGFINDAVMIAAGSIWAKNLWGSYWSWDPVETWSLLSWLIYGLAIHLRQTLGWRERKLAWLLVFAIVGVLISFWGVNVIISGSLHVFNVE